MKAQKWVLVKNFVGEPKDEDLELQDEELPELQDGDILIEAEWWTVDPYMRPMANNLKPGDTMIGEQLGRVTQSKNSNYPVGYKMTANVGWRTHTIFNPDKSPSTPYSGAMVPMFRKATDTGSHSPSLALGILGMPGATAYLGFLKICDPQPGETVLVSGAAGAVGSAVGQIAKIKGCTVIGFAGTDDKVQYLKEIGYDFAYNYKTCDVSKSLQEAAPDGIDCYFDNVGGEFSTTVLFQHMKTYSRVSICGVISRYNADLSKPAMMYEIYGQALFKQMRIEGFIVYRWYNDFPEAFNNLRTWIEEGRLKYREDVSKGISSMRQTFYGVLKGHNRGKAIIQATSEDQTKL